MLKKDKVRLVEVGPRDGLQNEKKILDIKFREKLIRSLADAGMKRIEIGAFVSPKWVPQMEGTLELAQRILKMQEHGEISQDISFSALVPNKKGMEIALQAGLKEVAIFGACSETFSKKNINCTIAESFIRFKEVMSLAQAKKIKVRGYLSTVFGCPYEGQVSEERVVRLTKAMFKLGVYEISLGDTIGVATPKQVDSLLRKIKRAVPVKKVAMHFHDTRGTALPNALTSFNLGVRVFDSSVGGLGGCPYAKGAAGNVATEDMVYMFMGMKQITSIDLSALIGLRALLESELGRNLPARVSQASFDDKIKDILHLS
jgi:hydroxymethylglutaryl-CoA lyase